MAHHEAHVRHLTGPYHFPTVEDIESHHLFAENVPSSTGCSYRYGFVSVVRPGQCHGLDIRLSQKSLAVVVLRKLQSSNLKKVHSGFFTGITNRHHFRDFVDVLGQEGPEV